MDVIVTGMGAKTLKETPGERDSRNMNWTDARERRIERSESNDESCLPQANEDHTSPASQARQVLRGFVEPGGYGRVLFRRQSERDHVALRLRKRMKL
jgi:hypothetical protein